MTDNPVGQESKEKSPPIAWELLTIFEDFADGNPMRNASILNTSFVSVKLIEVIPGFDIPPHFEGYNAIFYIIRGRGSIQIGAEIIDVNPGMLVFSPKEKLRGIHSSEALLILGLQEPHGPSQAVWGISINDDGGKIA